MLNTTPRFIFGSDAETPHQQYILRIDTHPVTRYIPWRYKSQEAINTSIVHRNQLYAQVPGFTVILICQLRSRSGSWINVAGNTDNYANMLEEVKSAAEFYLQYKINPNAKKYTRYKIPEDFTESVTLPGTPTDNTGNP